MLKRIAAGIVILIVARGIAVLAFSVFVLPGDFWEALTNGTIFARLFAAGGWPVTLLIAAVLMLAWFTLGRNARSSAKAPEAAAHDGQNTGTLRRLAPVAGLLVLAPWVGEYLLGNVPLGALVALPFLIPLYGGGALLIREAARHTGRGYPAILTLGLAYGIIEAGLFDQSLFNTTYQGVQNTGTAYIPGLGISAYNAVAFTAGHAVWSITIPIAIVELLTPSRRTTPWLGPAGLIATAAIYLLGGWIVFADLQAQEQFMATPGQLAGVAVVATALIAAALTLCLPAPAPAGRQAARPLIVAAVTFVLINAFFLRPENWLGVALGFVFLGGLAAFLWVMANRPGWHARHQFAAVAATLPTYAGAGFLLTAMLRPDDSLAWTGNLLFALVALTLLLLAAKKAWRNSPSAGSA